MFYPFYTPIDFEAGIARNRDELLGIVATLFAMLGLAEGVVLGRIRRGLHSAVLRILRPAESAVRRLIVVAARGMVAESATTRPRTKRTGTPKESGKRSPRTPRTPAFNLSDKHAPWLPPKHKRKPTRPLPRISVFGLDPTIRDVLGHSMAMFRAEHGIKLAEPEPKSKPESDGLVDAARLIRRLLAIKAALEDIPRQARRLARWKATRERQADAGKLVHTEPLREGRPPGFHEINSHEVDRLLDECTWLAMQALKPDTS